MSDYVAAVREMACKVLELMAEGLRILPKDVFSRLLKDKQSDSLFRLNHYPPRPEEVGGELNENNLVGFGEHTDPQIISVLRSNNTAGLEISLKDGNWVSVPPDQASFFINVGDSLQVGLVQFFARSVIRWVTWKIYGSLALCHRVNWFSTPS